MSFDPVAQAAHIAMAAAKAVNFPIFIWFPCALARERLSDYGMRICRPSGDYREKNSVNCWQRIVDITRKVHDWNNKIFRAVKARCEPARRND